MQWEITLQNENAGRIPVSAILPIVSMTNFERKKKHALFPSRLLKILFSHIIANFNKSLPEAKPSPYSTTFNTRVTNTWMRPETAPWWVLSDAQGEQVDITTWQSLFSWYLEKLSGCVARDTNLTNILS